jgi:hypothetical protein
MRLGSRLAGTFLLESGALAAPRAEVTYDCSSMGPEAVKHDRLMFEKRTRSTIPDGVVS